MQIEQKRVTKSCVKMAQKWVYLLIIKKNLDFLFKTAFLAKQYKKWSQQKQESFMSQDWCFISFYIIYF